MFLIGGFNRSFPFRVTYESVLTEIEEAEEAAKKLPRAPRSYDESSKKRKTDKIVTKKNDAPADEKKKKKPKQMAKSNKQVEEEEELIEEDEQEPEKEDTNNNNNNEENQIDESKEPLLANQVENDRVPLEEVQQPTLTVAEKLAAIGKKPAPFSKTSSKYVEINR